MLKNKVEFNIRGRRFVLTRHLVGKAMRAFNSTARLSGRDSGSRYAVFDEVGMPYPPKRILSICTGCRPHAFSGGTRVNNVFKMLGFHVRKAPRSVRLRERWPRTLPSITVLVKRLFSQRWSKFDQDFIFGFRRRFDARYPGVYMFAYPKKGSSLEGKRVSEDQVYYVGSSPYAGLGARLTQFWHGARRGGYHSGANRFFRKEGSYRPENRPLYVTWLAVPAKTGKMGRSALDLQKMGAVAYLELAAIGRILAKCSAEPLLNKK